jgi:SHS2 domain-containing protein
LNPGWRHFDHRADIGVEGIGRSPDEAFAQAALALTAIVCDPAAWSMSNGEVGKCPRGHMMNELARNLSDGLTKISDTEWQIAPHGAIRLDPRGMVRCSPEAPPGRCAKATAGTRI